MGIQTDVAGAAPGIPLRDLARQHRGKLALTYGLTGLENLCEVLYPSVTGLAVDGLLAGRPGRLAPLLLVWMGHLVVGVLRHAYDTRVFTQIYAELATGMVARQRAACVNDNQIVGRVALSRELVDFLEVQVPALGRATGQIAGATAMLFSYDALLGGFAVLAFAPIWVTNRWFGRRSYRLTKGLNGRLEREVWIVAASPIATVRRHFDRLRFWRVRISNAEVWTWTAVELVMIALTLGTLLRLTSSSGTTIGAIYAVLAYVFTIYEGVESLPTLAQNIGRARDISERVAGRP